MKVRDMRCSDHLISMKSEIINITILCTKDIESSCTVECMCREGSGNESAKFVCAHIDCPEFFGAHHMEKEDMPGKKCVRQYKANGCCSTGQTCGMVESSSLAF